MGRAAQITEPLAFHGEGPVWFDDRQKLRWVDMLQGDVLIFGADGTVDRRQLATPVVAAVRPRGQGGCVVATEHGFAFQRDLDDVELEQFAPTIVDPAERVNEGACDPDG